MAKLTNCKSCGNQVNKGSNCPNCGKDSRNFFVKHKVITVILVLAIIGILASAGEPSSNSAEGGVGSEITEEQNKAYGVGEVVQLKDLNFVVNKVYNVAGNQFAKPKDGNEFIAIDCTVENTSSADKAVSSIMMFKVVDKDGRQCEYSLMGLTAANAGQLDGTVGAGRKITGVYVVEVPAETTGLELEFNSSVVTGKQVIVKLN